MTNEAKMRAWVLSDPGGPEALDLRWVSVPDPGRDQVLIEVKAFGINRSELMTRAGLSPSVTLPRILGIEAVGEIALAPGGQFAPGTPVATVMGGMGRAFDGSYAEYVCVPASQVRPIQSSLSWSVYGALPEMLQTAWGALFINLKLQSCDTLFIRGGASSVGLAACALAKRHGARVYASSRRRAGLEAIERMGAIPMRDDGELRHLEEVGFNAALDFIGVGSLPATMALVEPAGGRVCMLGAAGGGWGYDTFAPMVDIPNGVALSGYLGDVPEFMAMPLDELAGLVASGDLPIEISRTYAFDDLQTAHSELESGRATGKLVVSV